MAAVLGFSVQGIWDFGLLGSGLQGFAGLSSIGVRLVESKRNVLSMFVTKNPALAQPL